MTKQLWLNLAVKDVAKTQKFYEALGFSINSQAPNNETMVSIRFGDQNFIINFFREDVLNGIVGGRIGENASSRQMVISIDAENEAEVNDMITKVVEAGGELYGKPGYSQGWMYGAGFLDPDGHQWNLLYMDFSKMPQ